MAPTQLHGRRIRMKYRAAVFGRATADLSIPPSMRIARQYRRAWNRRRPLRATGKGSSASSFSSMRMCGVLLLPANRCLTFARAHMRPVRSSLRGIGRALNVTSKRVSERAWPTAAAARLGAAERQSHIYGMAGGVGFDCGFRFAQIVEQAAFAHALQEKLGVVRVERLTGRQSPDPLHLGLAVQVQPNQRK